MIFKLVYRPHIQSELISEGIDVDTFAELFAAVENRVETDHCHMCTILAEDGKALGYACKPDGIITEVVR